MTMHRRRLLQSAGAGLAILALSGTAWPQTFPTRPVTLIVPFSAGGSNDVTSRALAKATQKYLGQPIVIDNVTGAGGIIGATRAAEAKPDGYTLVTTVMSVLLAPDLGKTPYDSTTDFTFIRGVFEFAAGVVVKSDAPWRTFQEFLEYAKANPGKVNYAASGIGTMQHIAMQRIAKLRGIQWSHVPYRGDPESFNALLGGHLDAVGTTSSWAELVDSGQLRLLVTWGEQRTTRWPNVPTLKETGLNLSVRVPYGISGPKGMNAGVVKVLHDALQKGAQEPEFIATLKQLDEEALDLNSGGYRALALEQIAANRVAIEEMGLRSP